eukprot:SAG11_NODE_29_length_23137_cov_16.739995_11_plen_421_part_00
MCTSGTAGARVVLHLEQRSILLKSANPEQTERWYTAVMEAKQAYDRDGPWDVRMLLSRRSTVDNEAAYMSVKTVLCQQNVQHDRTEVHRKLPFVDNSLVLDVNTVAKRIVDNDWASMDVRTSSNGRFYTMATQDLVQLLYTLPGKSRATSKIEEEQSAMLDKDYLEAMRSFQQTMHDQLEAHRDEVCVADQRYIVEVDYRAFVLACMNNCFAAADEAKKFEERFEIEADEGPSFDALALTCRDLAKLLLWRDVKVLMKPLFASRDEDDSPMQQVCDELLRLFVEELLVQEHFIEGEVESNCLVRKTYCAIANFLLESVVHLYFTRLAGLGTSRSTDMVMGDRYSYNLIKTDLCFMENLSRELEAYLGAACEGLMLSDGDCEEITFVNGGPFGIEWASCTRTPLIVSKVHESSEAHRLGAR